MRMLSGRPRESLSRRSSAPSRAIHHPSPVTSTSVRPWSSATRRTGCREGLSSVSIETSPASRRRTVPASPYSMRSGSPSARTSSTSRPSASSRSRRSPRTASTTTRGSGPLSERDACTHASLALEEREQVLEFLFDIRDDRFELHAQLLDGHLERRSEIDREDGVERRLELLGRVRQRREHHRRPQLVELIEHLVYRGEEVTEQHPRVELLQLRLQRVEHAVQLRGEGRRRERLDAVHQR